MSDQYTEIVISHLKDLATQANNQQNDLFIQLLKLNENIEKLIKVNVYAGLLATNPSNVKMYKKLQELAG